MAVTINRAPWNALVDDSGQNLDGSIWNKAAIKTTLLDPIDAALAQLSTLYKGTGNYLATGIGNLFIFTVPALLVTDTLKLYVSTYQAAGNGLAYYYSAVGDQAIVRMDDIGGGTLGAGNRGTWEITIRTITANTNAQQGTVLGGSSPDGATYGIRGFALTTTLSNWVNGGWNIGIQTNGQSAGGSQQWSAALHRFTG